MNAPGSAAVNEWEGKLSKWVREACIAEVSFQKPGNVTLSHGFDDADAADFIKSAEIIAPMISAANADNIGETILSAVGATKTAVGHNTNLGIVLLLAPLAAVPRGISVSDGIEAVLSALTVDDAVLVYRAIAAAAPGGLGEAESQDITDTPSQNLRVCMALAADRDLIAAQYVNGFRDVLEFGLIQLISTRDWSGEMSRWRIGWLAVELMARR